MTGYDLVKYFDGSIAFLWQAPHSQIYPELRRMEKDELIRAEEVKRGERATKRVYRICEKGTAELRAWADTILPPPPERDVYRLKAACFEWASYDTARRQLTEYRNHYRNLKVHWQQDFADIEALRLPLLRSRLASRTPDEAEAIVAFKLFAYRGLLGRAKAEIAWADEGLDLIDRLESTGAPLARSW
jgi:PadR family transcriptional regulator AphA